MASTEGGEEPKKVKPRSFNNRKSKIFRKGDNVQPPSAFENVMNVVRDSPNTARRNSGASERSHSPTPDPAGGGYRDMNNDFTALELPALGKEKNAVKRKELLLEKLELCCNVFDFSPMAPSSDPFVTSQSKAAKTAALNDLIKFTTNKTEFMAEDVFPEYINMISLNLFRAVAPPDDPKAAPYDPEDDEPRLEPGWPHIELVYALLIRIVEHKSLNVEVALKNLDVPFAHKLIGLFCSEDPRERDLLKTAVHRIYGRFMKLRVQIRERFNQMLLAYTHGTFFFGVAEVLEFLGCIINGFAMPLKDEHRTTLLTVFLPLHRHKSMAIYHPQLAYCVTQFLSKAPDLVERTLKYLFRYWPKTAAQKQVHLLNQVEGIVGVIEYPEFIQVAPMLFKKLGDCIEDTHFMVSESALRIWNQGHMIDRMKEVPDELYHLVGPAIYRNSKRHWSGVVHDSNDRALKTLQEISEELFAVHCNDETEVKSAEEVQAEQVAAREERWAAVEEMAAMRAAEINFTIQALPTLPTACPDVFMKGENISPHRQGGKHKRARPPPLSGANAQDAAAAAAEADADSDDDNDAGPSGMIVPIPMSPTEKSFVRRKSILPQAEEVKAALEEYATHDLGTDPSPTRSKGLQRVVSQKVGFANTHDDDADAGFEGFGGADAAGAADRGSPNPDEWTPDGADGGAAGAGVDSTAGCWLVKRKSGAFGRSRRRWFMVDVPGNRIVYHVDVPATLREEPRGVILLDKSVSVKVSGKQLVIATAKRTFSLAAASSVVPQEWQQLVSKIINGAPVQAKAAGNQLKGQYGGGATMSPSTSASLIAFPGAGAEPWDVGVMKKAVVEASVVASSHGDFLVRRVKEGGQCVVCINDNGKAQNFTINCNAGGKLEYGGQPHETVAGVIDLMRTDPPISTGGKLWLMDAAPLLDGEGAGAGGGIARDDRQGSATQYGFVVDPDAETLEI